MSSLTITPEEKSQLEVLARNTKDKKTADRIRIILALASGHTVRDVAEILLLDEETIRKWKNKYQKRRLFSDWLATSHKGYDGKLDRNQLLELECHVEKEMVTDAAVLVEFIKNRFGQKYTVDGVTKLLHRLGFVYKQTTLVPGKLDEEAQKTWLKGYGKLKGPGEITKLKLSCFSKHSTDINFPQAYAETFVCVSCTLRFFDSLLVADL
jgi:transposase